MYIMSLDDKKTDAEAKKIVKQLRVFPPSPLIIFFIHLKLPGNQVMETVSSEHYLTGAN